MARNGFNDILLEQQRIDSISQPMTKKLINGLLLYLNTTFGKLPTSIEIIQACIATVTLFPSLKTEPSEIDGIDRLYNNRDRKGLLYNKIKNSRADPRNKQQGVVDAGGQLTPEEEDELCKFT